MKRAPIVLSATVLGLAATLGFTHHAEPASTATTAALSAPAASSGSSTASGTSSSSGSSSSSSGSSSSSSSSSTKTSTGDAIATQYGNVQLKVTVAGGKITKIEAVQLPGGDPKSSEISSYAEPQLQQSALSKQDGTVDAVSGATFTSNGYQAALQSALDQAGFQASSSATA
jgi:uncharacterized protein with FMN-binding domain